MLHGDLRILQNNLENIHTSSSVLLRAPLSSLHRLKKMVATDFHIDTERLVISHLDSLNDAHCDFLVDLYNSEQNRARGAALQDREAARKKVESLDPVKASGYGRYLVSLKPPPQPDNDTPFSERANFYTKVGCVSLNSRKFKNAPLAPDVGYNTLPIYQGKGYATEAAMGLMRWFEEDKGQTEFFGFCDPSNKASTAVLRRVGFEERGVRNVKGMYSDESAFDAMVFSKGLTKSLEEYNLS